MTDNLATRPVPRPGVMDIEAYVPGKSAAKAGGKVHKLSSNETPLGASPKAIAAYQNAATHLELYPDGAATNLRAVIGGLFGIDPAQIVCGAGSDEILSMITNAYVGPGGEGIFTTHGFLVYKIAILAAGGTPIIAEETDLTANVDAILAKVTPRTKIVFLANPNNPTGTYISADEVRRLHAGLPANVILVLDAAYAEYARKNDYTSGLELVAEAQNVVMTRTFSKIYGLAAVRLGWCYAPPHICDALNRIRGPFNVNTPAALAGIAALQDQPHIAEALSHNDKWLPWLAEKVGALGLTVTASVANFILIHFPSSGPFTAANADKYLAEHGLILRAVGAYGLPDCLRLTVGSAEANESLVVALTQFMKAGTHAR